MRTRAGWLVALAIAASLSAHAQEGVRPEVGKPLLQAGELIRVQRYKEALDKVREAEAVGARSANETLLIERMRIAAAGGAGDTETAARSLEAIGTRVGTAERVKMIESIAGAYYRAGKYAQAVQWSRRYFGEGGSSGSMRMLLVQSQYLTGDFQAATKGLTDEIQQAEKSGSLPGEDRLKLLASAALRLEDNNSYVYALERLVTHYPKKEYWADLLTRLRRKPGFSARLALDIFRLSLATGNLSQAGDFFEMAQLSLQAGFPAEARQVLEKGFDAKALGQGDQAGRHKRLHELAAKTLAESRSGREAAIAEAQGQKDGTALVSVGMNFVFEGHKEKGLQLLQQGMAKGNFKRPNDVKLHQGVVLIAAGEFAKAQQVLKTVGGDDGTADMARLWSLYAKRR